jgi:hypothetical protein
MVQPSSELDFFEEPRATFRRKQSLGGRHPEFDLTTMPDIVSEPNSEPVETKLADDAVTSGERLVNPLHHVCHR